MAQSVIRLDEDENMIFHANYNYMWKKLNTAPYYVCGYGEMPENINAPWLLPSYANLSKCMNTAFTPSMNIVNKIVAFYNANITPAVDSYLFLHEKLEESNSLRSVGCENTASLYEGFYYGFYYAGIEDESIIYSMVIRIFKSGNSMSAYVLAGIGDDNDLVGPELKEILQSKDVPASYREYKKQLPVTKRRTSLYFGEVTCTPGMLTLTLKDADKDNSYLHIRIPAKSSEDTFAGSLGVATLILSEYDIQFLKIGIESADIKELKLPDMGDDKLHKLLSLKKTANEHVHLSVADSEAWLNYIFSI